MNSTTTTPEEMEEMLDLDATIWDILDLCRGKHKRVRRVQLVEMTGAKDRAIRESINRLITRHGKMILSNYTKGGYYLPKNQEEIDRYCQELHSHAISILRREAAIKKKSLAELLAEYQLELYT